MAASTEQMAKRRPMSREAKAAAREIRKSVRSLARTVADIQHGLGDAERKIEAGARERIHELRREVRGCVRLVEARRREAERTLARLTVAAGGSWETITESADRMLGQARRTADSVRAQFRQALR